MKKKITLGIDRWVIIEQINDDAWQIVESHGNLILRDIDILRQENYKSCAYCDGTSLDKGDIVKDYPHGLVVYADAICEIPKYVIPSTYLLNLVEDYNLGEEEQCLE